MAASRLLFFIFPLLLPTPSLSISYRCENNQVLIVQNFGNDTIRMHCQKLNLCSNEQLKCNYDREQTTCGGKNNFVAHVTQANPTAPVRHTCCGRQLNGHDSVPGHDGNDCFVYELPDGTASEQHKADVAARRKIHSVDWSEFTVLQNAQQIPEQFDGYVGYRMRLFMLRNKSPPTLIVKAIERVSEGYRVTICRPRCGKFSREGAIGHDEKPDEVTSITKPDEWAAASWSSWSSSTWSTWSATTWSAWEEAEANGRKNAQRSDTARSGPSANDRPTFVVDNGADGSATGSSGAPGGGSTKSHVQSEGGTPPGGAGLRGGSVNNHNTINVRAEGGQGGAGGIGGQAAATGLGGNAQGGNGVGIGAATGIGVAALGSGRGDKEGLNPSVGPTGPDGSGPATNPWTTRGGESTKPAVGSTSGDGDNSKAARTGRVGSDTPSTDKHGNTGGSDKVRIEPNKKTGSNRQQGLEPTVDTEDGTEKRRKGTASGLSPKQGVKPGGKSRTHDGSAQSTEEVDNVGDGRHINRVIIEKDGSGGTVNGKDIKFVPDDSEEQKESDGTASGIGKHAKAGGSHSIGSPTSKKSRPVGHDEGAIHPPSGTSGARGASNRISGPKSTGDGSKSAGGTTGSAKNAPKDRSDAEGNESGKHITASTPAASDSVTLLGDKQRGDESKPDQSPNGKRRSGKGKGGDAHSVTENDGEPEDVGKLDEEERLKRARQRAEKTGNDPSPNKPAGDGAGGVDTTAGEEHHIIIDKEDGSNAGKSDGSASLGSPNKNAKTGPDGSAKDKDVSSDARSTSGNNGSDGSGNQKATAKPPVTGGTSVTRAALTHERLGEPISLDKAARHGGSSEVDDGDDDAGGNVQDKLVNGSRKNNEGGPAGGKHTGDDNSIEDGTGDGGDAFRTVAPDPAATTPYSESAGGANVPGAGDEEGSGADGDALEGGHGGDDSAGNPEDYEQLAGGDDTNSVLPPAGGVRPAAKGSTTKHVAPRPRKIAGSRPHKAHPPARQRLLGSRTKVAAPQRASPEISDPGDLQFAPPDTADDPGAPAPDGDGGGGGGGGAGRNCFSGDTLVRTVSGEKLMKDLEVGDMVLVPASGNMLKYERVEMFYHREPETTVKFVRIQTESGKSLSLTALHLLPFGECSEMASSDFGLEGVQEWMRRSRFAHKAQVGECVLTLGEDDRVHVDRIVKVGRTYSKGIYSPMTVEGAIVTNNVLASCFSQIESHSVQKLAFDFLVMLYNAFGYMSGVVTEVQEIPSMLDYVHRLSWYVVPFAKY